MGVPVKLSFWFNSYINSQQSVEFTAGTMQKWYSVIFIGVTVTDI